MTQDSYDDVMARIPKLTPAESAEESAITIEKMLELLVPWKEGRWAYAISKLEELRWQFREIQDNPTATGAENLLMEFLGLLYEVPPFRHLELAADLVQVVGSLADHLTGLEHKQRDGRITDDERASLPDLKRTLESLRSDNRRYLKQFEDEMSGIAAIES